MEAMKRRKQYLALSTTLFSALATIFLFGIIAQAHAEEPPINPVNPLMVSMVTINDKADKYNFIFVGERRFRVSHTATILNYRGKSISLRLLPIPCSAEITYHLFGDNRDPLVQKIQLK